MSKKSLTEQELLDRLDASLAGDALTEAYTQEEVAEAIKAAGGDPAALGQRGAELAKQLLKERRLSWRRPARQRLEEAQSVSVEVNLATLSRGELLEAIEEARKEPSLGGLVGAFRKRKPEQASEEELRALLSEMRTLGFIIKAKDKRRVSKNE
jgi:hypothetical protein